MSFDEIQRVRVELGERSYDLLIGGGLLARAGKLLKPLKLGSRGVLITDSNVEPLYASVVQQSLADAGFAVTLISVPAGECSKSLRQANRLFEKLPGLKLDRHSFVVALGGGVVGDLAGFIAASYLRGINFIQIPTTLLAMVDSSIGGKTGVNLPQGKNLVGAFYQPRLVLADTATLASLPERELRAGFAEVIKTGAIYDLEFFTWLEKKYRRVMRLESAAVSHAVRRCCEIKSAVVGADEREGGLRAILNFGHTIGHAMEALRDYTGLLHGEAVAIGMNCAARLSVRRTGLPATEAKRIVKLCKASGLPVCAGDGYDLPALRAAMSIDKKAVAGRLRFVLLERLGKAVVSESVTDRDIEEVVNECR